MNRIIYIGALIILCGCGRIYEIYIPSWLGLKKIEIEDYKYFDVMTGIGGEGATLEIYELSIKNIDQILSSIDTVALPLVEGFDYQMDWNEWYQVKKDSSLVALLKGNLNTSGYGKMEPYLNKISKLLLEETTYVAIYYNRKELSSSYRFLYLVLDSVNRELYVYDLMI